MTYTNQRELLAACEAALGCFGKDEQWWRRCGPAGCRVSEEQIRAGVIWQLQAAIAKAKATGNNISVDFPTKNL